MCVPEYGVWQNDPSKKNSLTVLERLCAWVYLPETTTACQQYAVRATFFETLGPLLTLKAFKAALKYTIHICQKFINQFFFSNPIPIHANLESESITNRAQIFKRIWTKLNGSILIWVKLNCSFAIKSWRQAKIAGNDPYLQNQQITNPLNYNPNRQLNQNFPLTNL